LAESEFHFDYHDRLFDRREAAKKNKTADTAPLCRKQQLRRSARYC